jgi:hypothetical protein
MFKLSFLLSFLYTVYAQKTNVFFSFHHEKREKFFETCLKISFKSTILQQNDLILLRPS